MVTARALADDYPTPDLFVAADTSTPDGAAAVIEQVMGHGSGAVHVVGGSRAPSGGFAVNLLID